MARIATYLVGAALVLALVPATAGAQDIGGSVGGAVSGAVDGAASGLGIGADANGSANTGIGVDRDSLTIQNRTSAGVRANVDVEDEDEQTEGRQAQRRASDRTVTGSVSATGGECNTTRDGICRD